MSHEPLVLAGDQPTHYLITARGGGGEGRGGGGEGTVSLQTLESGGSGSPELADEPLQDEASLQSEVTLRVTTPPRDSGHQPLQVW